MSREVHAKASTGYKQKIGRWLITGEFNKSGIVCAATVATKDLGNIVVGYIAIGNDENYFLTVKKSSVEGVVPREQAESILSNRYLLKNGKRLAEINGSSDVVQELNRCIEAGAFRSGGE